MRLPIYPFYPHFSLSCPATGFPNVLHREGKFVAISAILKITSKGPTLFLSMT